MSQRILLITKNYPPQIGWIEKYAYDLYTTLTKEWNDVKLIVAGPRSEFLLAQNKRNVFWKVLYISSELYRLFNFSLRAFFGGIWWCIIKKGDLLVWSIDGSIAWLGLLIKKITWTRTRVTLHGTDVLWNNPVYQTIVPKFWCMTDEIFVVSKAIEYEAKKRKVPWNRVFLCEHSVDTMYFPSPWTFDKDVFLQSYFVPNDKIILFSIGRFIELKWFDWFISEVLPMINCSSFHYVLAGFGPLEALYRKIIQEKSIQNITLIWPIRDEIEKARWYTVADHFVMPNIKSNKQIEWFGIVLLEAQYYKLPCIVSDIDGLWGRVIFWKDILLPPNCPSLWVQQINFISKTVNTLNK